MTRRLRNRELIPSGLIPSELIPSELRTQLDAANARYSRNKNFPTYKRSIEEIFNLQPVNITKEAKYYLGGFIEGEGSMNVSLKKHNGGKFGLLLDPEFSLTQHLNSISDLHLALTVFNTGRIRIKGGSNATMVLVIDNRQSIEDKVIPFAEQHMIPFCSIVKRERVQMFKKILNQFNEGKHKDAETFAYEILPLWDELRMQRGQSNQTFATLAEAQEYLFNFRRLNRVDNVE